jgi:hypothetical protein
MSYLLRIALPDRPGALGAVATALGEAGIDIVSLAIVDRGPTGAVDDLVVELPPMGLADRVLTAAQSVPGVRVEALRHYSARDGAQPDDLEVADALAARPEAALATLTDTVSGVFHADWAVLLERLTDDDVRVRRASTGAPDLGRDDMGVPERIRGAHPWLPLARARRIDTGEGGFPERWLAVGMELAAAPVGDPCQVVLVGRPGGPRFRPSEAERLAHLAGIAATVTRIGR